MDNSVNTKKLWKDIKPGDIIGIQDEQAIEDQMEEGKELGETDYEVERIKTFKSKLAEYILIELVNEDETIILSVKIVDSISLRIYFEIDEVEQGNRVDMLENGCDWIFEEPEDQKDFMVSELEYTKVITQTIDDEDVEFKQLPHGELHGECICIPEETGIDDPVFMTLVEYSTDTDIKNPFIMITEEEEVIEPDEDDEDDEGNWNEGNEENEYSDEGNECDWNEDDEETDNLYEDAGGNITVYLGADITPMDINIYPGGK